MKTTRIGLSVTCIALFGSTAAGVVSAADAETPVLAKDLNTARLPGKVAAVLWTVRTDHCTLQIVFPNAGRIAQAVRNDPEFKARRPDIQAWLLKADGTLIAPTRRLEPGVAAKDRRQPYGVEILFDYPLSADKEAVAAAISIDGEFYIEQLGSLARAK